MRAAILKTLMFGALLANALLWPVAHAAQSQNSLTNQDIIRMVKNALPESVILSTIQTGPTDFDASADGLISLHRAGVTKRVMDAVMAAAANRQPQTTNTATSPTPSTVAVGPVAGAPMQGPPVTGATQISGNVPTVTVPPTPSVVTVPVSTQGGVAPAALVAGQPTVMLFPTGSAGVSSSQAAVYVGSERTQQVETKTKPTSMSTSASDSALQAGVNTVTSEVMMHPGSSGAGITFGQSAPILSTVFGHHQPQVTYVWALQGLDSANSLATSTPRFGIDYSKVPGINPEDFEPAIVKLTPSQNMWRLAGATQGKEDVRSNSTPDWQVYADFLEDRVTVATRKSGPGQYEISPASPLLPGEYGIVLRPVSKTKKFSGGDIARYQGDGMIFDSVWSFQVPAGAQAW